MTLPSPAPSPITSYNNKQSSSHHDLYGKLKIIYIYICGLKKEKKKKVKTTSLI